MKWIVWTNITLAAAGGQLAASLPVGTPGSAEEGSQDAATSGVESRWEQAEKARLKIESALKVLNGALVGKEFLLGYHFCLADTHMWSFVSLLTITGVNMTP